MPDKRNHRGIRIDYKSTKKNAAAKLFFFRKPPNKNLLYINQLQKRLNLLIFLSVFRKRFICLLKN